MYIYNYNTTEPIYKIWEQNTSNKMSVRMQLLVDMVNSYNSVLYYILVKYTE